MKFANTRAEDPNVTREEVKDAVVQDRQEVINKRKSEKEKRQPWMTEDTLEVTEQRKQAKCQGNNEQYELLNK